MGGGWVGERGEGANEDEILLSLLTVVLVIWFQNSGCGCTMCWKYGDGGVWGPESNS